MAIRKQKAMATMAIINWRLAAAIIAMCDAENSSQYLSCSISVAQLIIVAARGINVVSLGREISAQHHLSSGEKM